MFVKSGHGENFNPRSPHGERLGSIVCGICIAYFNPRSPHGERRSIWANLPKPSRFQSTLPARGATLPGSGRTGRPPYFNPRSPHGERREPMISLFGAFVFQSTLPARGATNCTAPGLPRGGTFQSTLPARGATGCAPAERRNKSISIHAPRTGSDAIPRVQAFQSDISIHAPRTGSDPR